MTAFQILSAQSTLSLVAFALIARWHVGPRLAGLAVEDYLVPLTWVHVFRYAPMTLLVPGQVSASMPAGAAAAIAYGDLLSALAALAALILLKNKWKGALAASWLFNIIGSADVVNATREAIGARMYDIPTGFNWYIVNFYVPLLIVTHVMMINKLVRTARGVPARGGYAA